MSRVGTGFSRPSRQFKNTSFKGYGIEEEFHSNGIKNISTNRSPKLEKQVPDQTEKIFTVSNKQELKKFMSSDIIKPLNIQNKERNQSKVP